jgi:hypothetical protein
METLWQDVQFAVRMMRKNLGFTTAAVLCLMLGIAATTGIFTVVNAVLLQPLPYAHSEQLIRIYTEFPTFPNGGLRDSGPPGRNSSICAVIRIRGPRTTRGSPAERTWREKHNPCASRPPTRAADCWKHLRWRQSKDS